MKLVLCQTSLGTFCAVLLSLVWSLRALGAEGGDFVRLMNLGKAHLENRESAKAVEALQEAIKINAKSAPAYRNLARAHLIVTKADDALAALKQAARLERESAVTSYLSGLAHMRLTKFAEAVTDFETAVRLDAHTATLRYQLAGAYQAAGSTQKALDQLGETIRLDPHHASAHYKLANLARQGGDQPSFEKHNREFLRLRKLFGDETRTAEALERCAYTLPEAHIEKQPVAGPPIDVRFVDATAQAFGGASPARRMLVDVLEVEASGRPVFIVVDSTGIALLEMTHGQVFNWIAMRPEVPQGGEYDQLIVGDFYNDVPSGARYDARVHAKNDFALIGSAGVRLFKRAGPTAFADVTDAAGLGAAKGAAGRWLDDEHDGDLDLLLAGEGGLALWQNNGDGRFEDVTANVGITATGPVFDAVAMDLDSNVAIDVAVARGTHPTLVFENQRAGRFTAMKEPPGPWPAARLVHADDLDNDGKPDVVLAGENDATIVYGGRPLRSRIEFGKLQPAGLTFVDYDNDGWLDIVLVGKTCLGGETCNGRVHGWRNSGNGEFAPASEDLGLDAISGLPLRSVLSADADLDGDSDLLVVAERGLRLLRNDGGNANGQLKTRLVTIKTNPAGLGTHIELRAGDFWVTRTVNRLPIEIGVGPRKRLDSVQTLWTNGVVDNEIDLALTKQPLTILEKNVAAGSCPFLYAWDGSRFRFVTDLLGNSPLGLSLTREMVLPADPDEIVWIGDSDSIAPKDGKYELVVTSEFREVAYLDEAKLIAVDYPADVEVHSTDKLMFPPFPPSQVAAMGLRRRLLKAVANDGIDRTEVLADDDGRFAPPGRPLPAPYRGSCHPLELTLDFGDLAAERPWMLALTGWLQYGDASTNIALSQDKSLTIIPPTLYAVTASGELTKLDVAVGMPAGKTKTILCDLGGKLPSGASRLRLDTTFEIRWDRIALFERRPDKLLEIHRLDPTAAHTHWWGFSDLRSRTTGHPTTPDLDHRRDVPPWRTTLEGWCTRYGDVLPLISARDDRIVLLNGGDALTLQFDAATLPPVPAGQRRSIFFYSVGWNKDGDHNVLAGDTVEPLPVNDPGAPRADDVWQLEYNTRWVPRNRFAPEASASGTPPEGVSAGDSPNP